MTLNDSLFAEYKNAILKSNLPNKNEFISFFKLGIRLDSNSKYEGQLPIGSTKLGGIPDLPTNISWPFWNGIPQAFIAQINLSEMPNVPGASILPTNGFLYFFYDSENKSWGRDQSDKGCFFVHYYNGRIENLKATEFPSDLPEDAKYKPLKLIPTVIPSIPEPDHPLLKKLKLTDANQDEYFGIFEIAFDQIGKLHNTHTLHIDLTNY